MIYCIDMDCLYKQSEMYVFYRSAAFYVSTIYYRVSIAASVLTL